MLRIFKVARGTCYRCRKINKSPTVSSGELLLDQYMLVFASKCSPCSIKNKVAGVKYQLKLSALCDFLEMLSAPDFSSKCKLQLNKTAADVDEQARQ